MKDFFLKSLSETRILDFTNNFQEKIVPIEVRTDRFTGRVSRVLKFRWTLPQASHDPALIETARENCPFCPEQLEMNTPKFPADIIPEGRVRFGRSTVIPNAYPYCQYCGVAIFADDHYIPMNELTEDILSDAIRASLLFFEKLTHSDPSIRYYSINWNYMPTAGGSLFHPHFQVVANPEPTTFHARLIRKSIEYRTSGSANFWDDLIQYEKSAGERYIFAQDDVEFLSSYSPGGIFGEVLTIFRGCERIDAIGEKTWQSFLRGLTRCLRCFHRMHLDNLNMTLFLSRDGDRDFWVQARIMPRILIPPWGTSDVNYFEKGHDEKVVIFPPEDLAEAIRSTA